MKTTFHLIFIAAFLGLSVAISPKNAKELNGDAKSRITRREFHVETPPAKFFDYVPELIGCYNDKPAPDRSLPIMFANFRDTIDWNDNDAMKKTINKCAEAAKAKGIKSFGVQFYGECWTGPEAFKTYNKYGVSKNCWKGVGRHWTNAFYEFKFKPKTGNEIS